MFIMITIVVGAGVFTAYRLWRHRAGAPAAGMVNKPCVGLNGALVEPRK